MAHAFFKRHRELLDKAVQAIATCGYWSPYSESPSLRVYGETAAEGKAAFEARLNRSFALEQPGTVGRTGKGVSPPTACSSASRLRRHAFPCSANPRTRLRKKT